MTKSFKKKNYTVRFRITACNGIYAQKNDMIFANQFIKNMTSKQVK